MLSQHLSFFSTKKQHKERNNVSVPKQHICAFCTQKFCIRDLSGVFSISSLVKISIILPISNVFLKLYLNSLVYDSNISESSLKVFGNLRKFSENVRERSSALRNNFAKSSKIFGKWSDILAKVSKTPS